MKMHRFFTMVALIVAAALVSVGERTAAAQGSSPVPSPADSGITESMVDVGGRSLHLACIGSGSPTVLFDAGGPTSTGGASTVPEVGPFVAPALGTRFCAYDRAGSGQSEPHPNGVHTFADAAADLNALLGAPELDCPCVVIGESMGGSIALIALTLDPSGFAGLVLLDAPYPGYWDEFVALAAEGSAETSPELMGYVGGGNEESIDMATGFRQVVTPAQPPAMPIVVITHGQGYPPPCWPEAPCSEHYPVDEFETVWQAGEAALAEALGAQLVVSTNTGHSIATEDPELVIGLIAQVIGAVRDPSAWSTPVPSPIE
jgi:pimeloyl-ACP methyl ester carboxylesterase